MGAEGEGEGEGRGKYPLRRQIVVLLLFFSNLSFILLLLDLTLHEHNIIEPGALVRLRISCFVIIPSSLYY